MLAKYQCLHCGNIWEQPPHYTASCPKCNPQIMTGGKPTLKYSKWLNYEEMRKKDSNSGT